MKQKLTPLEQFSVGGVAYSIQVAALDTTDDGQINYDTLIFFDATQGIRPGPFSLPSTGPAYVRASDAKSSPFFLEGSSNKAGAGFYVTRLAADLSEVRVARYSANAIPRNLPVITDVDDINEHVGFWAPQPDFRIPERLSPGFGPFPDQELEAVYQDSVRLFVDYQTRVGLRAMSRFPDADLVMIYIEQPDGSGHQFLLTDPRQPTDFTNPGSIGVGQDPAKVARYASYVENAYRAANSAVQRVIEAVGTDAAGVPRSNIIVVSDHGFDIFHTAVSMNNFLAARGFDPAKVRAITSGPAANIYISLQGRQPNGTVSRQEYITLQRDLVAALKAFVDTNPHYTSGRGTVPVFDKVYARPLPANLDDPTFGRGTDEFIGQDSGDVSAILTVGYNFDGTQSPVVQRLGDLASPAPILSLPNFYGAHGYDPTLPSMSAIFMAAGPDIRRGVLTRVDNIDVAPTAARLLGVKLSTLVEGKAIPVRSPRRVKTELAAQLAALLPSADRRTVAHLERAVERFAHSLAEALWVDDANLSRQGAKVFTEERAAADHLLKIAGSLPAASGVVEGIVTADEELAAIAIDAAVSGGGDERLIDLARKALDKGAVEVASTRLLRAIDQYRNAWVFARKAMKVQVEED